MGSVLLGRLSVLREVERASTPIHRVVVGFDIEERAWRIRLLADVDEAVVDRRYGRINEVRRRARIGPSRVVWVERHRRGGRLALRQIWRLREIENGWGDRRALRR